MRTYILLFLALVCSTLGQAKSFTGSELYEMYRTGDHSVLNIRALASVEVGQTDDGCLSLYNTSDEENQVLIMLTTDVKIGYIQIEAFRGAEDDIYTRLDDVNIGGEQVGGGEKQVDFELDLSPEFKSGQLRLEYYVAPHQTLYIRSIVLNETSRAMSWDEKQVSIHWGEKFAFPMLDVYGWEKQDLNGTRFNSSLSLSSSNSQVARVFIVDGKVRMAIGGTGTATITAHVDADANTAAGDASFNLTVLPAVIEGSSEVVHLDVPGTLALALVDIESTQIGRLKVTGTINSADIRTLRSQSGQLSNIQEIDLSEANVEYDGGVYYSFTRHADVGLGYITTSYALCDVDDEPFDGVTTLGVGTGGNEGTVIRSRNFSAAFNGLSSLRKVWLPKSVTRIGQGAFSGCDNLVEVVAPEGICEVEAAAFRGCPCFTKHNLAALKAVGDNAFNGTPVFEADLSQVRYLGHNAFAGSALLEADLSSQSNIASGVFADCGLLSKVKFGSQLKTIGGGAFCNTALTSVTFPEGLERISSSAFDGSRLSTINFPSTLRHVVYDAFDDTPWQQSQYGQGIDGVVYWGNVAMWMDYKFPADDFNGVLKFCEGTVALSEGFKVADAIKNKVTEIQFPSTLKYTGSSHDPSFDPAIFRRTTFPNLVKVNLPEGLEVIGDILAGSKISELTIGPNIRDVEDYAFAQCNNLVRVNYACRAATGNNIFYFCTGLNKATIAANVVSLPERMFAACSGLLKVEFEGRDFTKSLKKAPSVSPSSASSLSVGASAFYSCENLMQCTLPWQTDSIGSMAFSGCYALSTFWLTPSMKYIGQNALPNKLTSIYNFMPEPYDFREYDDVFDNGANTTVYVLPDSYEAYCANTAWRKINIADMDEAHLVLSIGEARTEVYNAGTRVYNLQGMPVAKPSRGIYIVDGQKVMCR